MVLLDIEKAFDTVWHEALIFKMYKAGTLMDLIMLIDSYLYKREFVVSYEGQNSKPMKISAGVPQGSVLGPILFILFINDMPKCVNNILSLFADDTAIITNSGKHKILFEKTISYVKQIFNYFHKWKIKPNESKTELLVSNCNGRHSLHSIDVNGQIVSNNKSQIFGSLY